MNCKKCGEPLQENETICTKCGTENCDSGENLSETPNLHRFSAKKNIIIIVLAGVLALGIGGTAVALGIYNMPANRVSRYMGAAERYLSEQNYEQAIIEFQRVLEIEPMNVDAYLGMAEAYIAMGDTDNAVKILRTGLEQTADDRIREKLNELLLSLALERGNTYLSEEKYPQAESEFAGALEIDEKCVEAYIGKADSHIGEEDIDKAIEVLQKGFDITGDSSIKEKLDALIEERSAPNLLWTEVDGNISYRGLGHYIKQDGDLWRLCDKTGKFISDKKYAFISSFMGTDENNYAFVRQEDGKFLSVDKDLKELSELEAADHISISNQENPLIISWGAGTYNDDSDNAYLRIYSPDGTLLFNWNENESLDGSGKPANIDDSMTPDELRQRIVDLKTEEQRDYWCETIKVTFGRIEEKNINSKVYISFEFDATYDYDDSAERAAFEAERQQHLQEYGFHIGGYNRSTPTCHATVIYCVSLENGKLKWEKSDVGYNEYIEYEGDDYRILWQFSPLFYSSWILDRAGETKKEALFFHRTEYDPDFPSLYSYLDDRHMVFYKNKDDSSEERVYALYRIYWEESIKLPSNSDDIVKKIVELNKKHERVTEFYDSISWNNEMLEMGYLLVGKDDKWGFVSVDTGKELAMYDDASNFSNGYAVVTNNGKGCIIDSEFNVVSDEFPCTRASILGDGAFVVRTDDKILRLELEK